MEKRFCIILDELIMYDNHDVVNSAGAEIICRYLYAIEKVMQNVTKKDHWAGAESARRTNWELSKRYDVLEYYQSGVEAKEADDQVTSNMQRDATFLKHLGKVQGKSDAVPEAAAIK